MTRRIAVPPPPKPKRKLTRRRLPRGDIAAKQYAMQLALARDEQLRVAEAIALDAQDARAEAFARAMAAGYCAAEIARRLPGKPDATAVTAAIRRWRKRTADKPQPAP